MPTDHQEPEQIVPQKLGDYLDVMSKSVFQAGISWKVVEAKWPGTREAFRDFDVEKVATMSESDVDDLAQDTRVIRNRRKLEATVNNAQKIIELDDKHGSFQDYLRSFDDFALLVKSMRKEFKFLGEMGIYHFMYVVGEEVPPYEEWSKARPK